MPTYDAIVVFGFALTKKGEIEDHAKRAIDRAAELVRSGESERLIFCGSHPLKEGERKRSRECDVFAHYAQVYHPDIAHFIETESESTCIPENWLNLKLKFPELRRIKLITYKLLLQRVTFFGDKIYGDEAFLAYDIVDASPEFFADEARLLRDARCVLYPMRRGDHAFIQKRTWNALRLNHHHCPIHPRKH